MERGAQLGGKGLIAFRGRVRTSTSEVSTGWYIFVGRIYVVYIVTINLSDITDE